MSFLPPWLGLLLALFALGGLSAWVVQRGLKKQAQVAGPEQQSKINRRIQQEHLADLDRALAEGRLTALQHQAARDELLRHLLDDAARGDEHPTIVVPARWLGMVVALVLLSGLSYVQLGAPQTWWPEPLSQRVKISATTPEQLAEQTRLWQEATQKRPEDAQAWLTLARLHAAQNAHAPAEQALARVLALSPEPDLWIERAQMKALSAGGVYTGEPWQWIQNVLRDQPQHLNALVLAGSAALSEKRHAAAQTYWQQALALVPAESEAVQGLQQALAQAGEMAKAAAVSTPAAQSDRAAALASPNAPLSAKASAAGHSRALIQGEVRVSAQVQSQIGSGATLFVYALAEEGTRRPVAIWRGTPTAWPVPFALSDSMGMGAPPVLSDLKQVRLVARISKTAAAQKQPDDFQVELPGVKTGVQGVVLNITGRTP
ncbi:MAG: c-type cytochrome biogenesis protein CcmI [Limnohabitans sp.]|nr:c-type cytochrome biogenesis protein CcmI [Limnohabitans sp.]